MAENRELNLIIKVVDQATDDLKNLSNVVGKNSKEIGLALAGTGAAITGAMGLAVKAAADSENATAQLNAVLKSTKGIAGVTADEVLNLSSALQKLSPFEDEAITGAQSMLLTFTKIGKEIFPDATQTVLDMSTALGQDLKSSSIQLGKALNDPINGVNALRRVGVAFTDEQQDLIKRLVESGKTLEAQKLILAELSTEFSGSAKAQAETFGGQITVLKNQVGDLMEVIGNALIPALKIIASAIKPAVEAIAKFAEENPKLFNTIVLVVAGLGILLTIVGALIASWSTIVAIASVVGAVFTVLLGPVGLVIAIIAALIAVGYLLYRNWELIQSKAVEVWNSILAVFGTVVTTISNIFDAIVSVITGAWEIIKTIFALYVAIVVCLVITLFEKMGIDIVAVFQQIQLFLQLAWAFITEIFTFAISVIQEIWQVFWETLLSIFSPVWETIQSIITIGWESIKSIFTVASVPVSEAWKKLWDGVKSVAEVAWEGIKTGVKALVNYIIDQINSFIDAVNSVASKGGGALGISVPQIPKIPRLAQGGIVTKPTIAMIGEAGPEAVVPLGKKMQGGPSIVMNFYGDVTGEEIIAKVENALMRDLRNNTLLATS